MTTPLHAHPERNIIRLQLKQNVLLAGLDESAFAELARLLVVEDRPRGDYLLQQGGRDLRHYFVLDGMLKRIVASPEGREMTLRFADERDMETSHDAWRLATVSPYSIVCVTRARVAQLSMKEWADFLDRHPHAKRAYEDCITRVTSTMMAHAITLHLLDAPGRVDDFSYRHPQLTARLPQKELASHLNLSAETLCRLVRRPRRSSGLQVGPDAQAQTQVAAVGLHIRQ